MEIIIFSGTSEGRKISEYLSSNEINHDVCVATESGEAVMVKNQYAHINVGRLDEKEMMDYLRKNNPRLVVDATHPYAKVVTDNLKKACDILELCYIRVNRESSSNYDKTLNVESYSSTEECAKRLCMETGNILLSTGSKELAYYTKHKELIDRIYVRVLPSVEAIELCKKASINEKNIIAMYGPHTKEMNEAILHQYNIKHMVTKESGQVGGFSEKEEACSNAGVKLHVIERPDSVLGISLNECIKKIKEVFSIDGSTDPKLTVKLVGIGPGNSRLLTKEAELALQEADYIFGAARMLDSYTGSGVKIKEYMPDKIVAKLDEIIKSETKDEIKVVALFSGDTGLYSGATKLYKKLLDFGKCTSVTTLPGISSFSAMAAATNTDYQDAYLRSLHGKSSDEENINKIKELIEQNEKVFVLMSGKSDFDALNNIVPNEYEGEIIVGWNLSYENQKLIYTSKNRLKEDIENFEDGLFIVLIKSRND